MSISTDVRIPQRGYRRRGLIPFLLLPVTFTILTAVWGCGGSPSEPSEPQEIFPLSEGNTWYGRSRALNSDSLFVEAGGPVIAARRTSEFDGEIWYNFSDPCFPGIKYIRNGAEGLYGRGDSGLRLIAKYPAEVGDTLEVYPSSPVRLSDKSVSDGIVINQVAATDTMITVPAGTFRCYAYHRRAVFPAGAEPVSDNRDYFAPGIGLIKSVRIYYTADSAMPLYHIEWELTHYTLYQ